MRVEEEKGRRRRVRKGENIVATKTVKRGRAMNRKLRDGGVGSFVLAAACLSSLIDVSIRCKGMNYSRR
jgi:hypothetical protein